MDTNFYEQLKSKIDGKLVEAVEAAKRKVALLEKRRQESIDRLDSLKEQRTKLTASADISIADSVNAWEKFQSTLRKHNAEIDALEEAINTLTSRIIPAAKKELETVLIEFRKSIRLLCVEQVKDVTVEMNDLLGRLVELHDEQYGATRKIYADYGFMPGIYDDGVYASPNHDRVDFKVNPLNYLQLAELKNRIAVSPPKPSPAPIVEPDAGNEAGNDKISEKPEVIVEVATDTTEETKKYEGV